MNDRIAFPPDESSAIEKRAQDFNALAATCPEPTGPRSKLCLCHERGHCYKNLTGLGYGWKCRMQILGVKP